MKIPCWLPVVVSVLSTLAAPVQGVDLPSNAVDFDLGEGGAVIVPVFIDGQEPARFLLDTGASGSTVGLRLATRLGLEPVARTLVITPAGREVRGVARLERLAVGSAEVEDLLVSLVPDNALDGLGKGVAGILGQDFLSRFDYTIDYRRRRLVWGDRPSPGGTRLALHPTAGRFLVELPQAAAGPRARFVPDSGAEGLVVFEYPHGPDYAMEPLAGRGTVESSAGARLGVEFRRLPRLRVGDITLRDQVAAVVARTQPDAREGDGLLPLHVFASVTFASRDGYMVIRP